MAKKQKSSTAKPKSAKKPHRSCLRQSKSRSSIPWKWIGSGLLLLVLVVLALLFLRSNNTLSKEISAEQAYTMYQQGAFFLDVRSVQEWNQGHIPRSTLIPLDELPSRLNELPRNKDIVLVCLSGHRSKEGVNVLWQNGFERVTCLKGGLQKWVEAGYPLEK